MSTNRTELHAQATHPWLVTAICAGAMFMEMLDGTIILTAFPRMAVDFHTRPVDLSIGVTSYLLAMAALLPASGWIADRFGTRRVFLSAMAGFVLTSVLCALSHTLFAFAAARALQGACAALMSPVARVAMVRTIRGARLAQSINDGELAVQMARHHHVKAVRPQIDSSDDFWNFAARHLFSRAF